MNIWLQKQMKIEIIKLGVNSDRTIATDIP